MGILRISLSILLLSALTGCMKSNETLDEELNEILDRSVPLISPDELHNRMDRDIVLLDIRSPAEQKISVIPGAILTDYENFEATEFDDLSRQDTIILYCSVGYRSEKAGEKLHEIGFKHVLNLYGGIFDWKNRGYEVVGQDGNATDSVHTYNEAWSKYLTRGIAVYD